ncbi:NAD(P)/FAD-dependent oxidoreductase, partial [Erythrobacter sp. HI0019]
MPATEVNRALLKDGIANANIPALLMVLYQMTGKAAWLQEPFAPGRSPGLDDNDSGQLPDEIQTQIRAAAEEAIDAWIAGKPLAIKRPSNVRLAEMLSVAMTEHVPEEYGDIVAAGMGYDLEPATDAVIDADKTAIVIGGGVSGICAGIELGKLGIDYTLFEKNEDFGGTWFENRYPGCGVDTPSLTYTFSRKPNDWSMYFPLRDEIEGYLLDTAREFGLYDKARFRTHVEEARWNTATDQWDVTITTPDGKRETHSADYLFSAVGILNIPKYPQIDGLDEFAGEVYHTSRWPAE